MESGKPLCVNKEKYWYLFHYEECPVCGASEIWKERIYNKPKPKDCVDRKVFTYLNCYCIGK